MMSFLTATLFLFAIYLLRQPPMDESLLSPDRLELTELSERSRRRSVSMMSEAVEEKGCSRCQAPLNGDGLD